MRTVYLAKLVLVLILLASGNPAPATWDELNIAIQTKTVSSIGRTPQTNESYQLFQQELKDKNLTLGQHVKLNIFGFGGKALYPIYFLYTSTYADTPIPVYVQTSDPASLKWLKLPLDLSASLSNLNDESQFALLAANDFPYNVQPNIYHWVLWSNRKLQIELVRSIVTHVTKPSWQNVAYVNEPHQQSIPDVFHAQVFFHNPHPTDEDL